MNTTTTNDLKTNRLAAAETLCDAGARLTALSVDAGEYDLDLDMLAVKKLANYMQIKGAEMAVATQIDVSLGAAPEAVKMHKPVPEQVVGRRASLPRAADSVDLALGHFEEVLTLLGAASCRTLQPSLVQDLVLLAHAAALRGLVAMDRERNMPEFRQPL